LLCVNRKTIPTFSIHKVLTPCLILIFRGK
jgi:hypothetical protein